MDRQRTSATTSKNEQTQKNPGAHTPLRLITCARKERRDDAALDLSEALLMSDEKGGDGESAADEKRKDRNQQAA